MGDTNCVVAAVAWYLFFVYYFVAKQSRLCVDIRPEAVDEMTYIGVM